MADGLARPALVFGAWGAAWGVVALALAVRPIGAFDPGRSRVLAFVLLWLGVLFLLPLAGAHVGARSAWSLPLALSALAGGAFVLGGLISLWRWRRDRRAGKAQAEGPIPVVWSRRATRWWSLFALCLLGAWLGLGIAVHHRLIPLPRALWHPLLVLWSLAAGTGLAAAGLGAEGYFHDWASPPARRALALGGLALLCGAQLLSGLLLGHFATPFESALSDLLAGSILAPAVVIGFFRRYGILP